MAPASLQCDLNLHLHGFNSNAHARRCFGMGQPIKFDQNKGFAAACRQAIHDGGNHFKVLAGGQGMLWLKLLRPSEIVKLYGIITCVRSNALATHLPAPKLIGEQIARRGVEQGPRIAHHRARALGGIDTRKALLRQIGRNIAIPHLVGEKSQQFSVVALKHRISSTRGVAMLRALARTPSNSHKSIMRSVLTLHQTEASRGVAAPIRAQLE